jgi:hypothetical protein
MANDKEAGHMKKTKLTRSRGGVSEELSPFGLVNFTGGIP